MLLSAYQPENPSVSIISPNLWLRVTRKNMQRAVMGKTKWIVAFFAVSLIVVSPCYAQEWAKTFGGTSDDSASCVRQTKDKGYIIAGSAWSFGPGRT